MQAVHAHARSHTDTSDAMSLLLLQIHPIDIVYVHCNRNHELHHSVRLIISQLFTYMALTRVEFAFLSCWHFTWLVRRPFGSGCNTLQISVPFLASLKCEGDNISTMAALSWIQSIAFEQTHLNGNRHTCVPDSEQWQELQDEEEEEEEEKEGGGQEDDDEEDWAEKSSPKKM